MENGLEGEGMERGTEKDLIVGSQNRFVERMPSIPLMSCLGLAISPLPEVSP